MVVRQEKLVVLAASLDLEPTTIGVPSEWGCIALFFVEPPSFDCYSIRCHAPASSVRVARVNTLK